MQTRVFYRSPKKASAGSHTPTKRFGKLKNFKK